MINNNDLINQIKSYNKFLNSETLSKAYNFALEAHQNQKREEGVPYIIHPVAVAKILTELKLDSATITTGLLHDTIEDTKVTYESVKKEFGEEVANLVDGVTKISALESKASSVSKAENFRKLILATSKDIRVLLVKLADRLHNMRTIQFVKDKDKKIRKAKETMEIYAPLAERMGMNTIRDELEDLSFSVLNKPARDLIIERLHFIKNNKDDTFKSISSELIELLNKNGVEATITGREKTPFSIWRKIQSKRVSLEQLTDVMGFRVIVDNIETRSSLRSSLVRAVTKVSKPGFVEANVTTVGSSIKISTTCTTPFEAAISGLRTFVTPLKTIPLLVEKYILRKSPSVFVAFVDVYPLPAPVRSEDCTVPVMTWFSRIFLSISVGTSSIELNPLVPNQSSNAKLFGARRV